MKSLLIIFLFAGHAGISQTSSEVLFKQLLKNEQALMDAVAVGDKAVWKKHLHDSCLIAVENGTTIKTADMIAELNPLPAGYVGRIHIIEPKFQLYGNTAVITFINDEYLELFNQKIHTQYRQTDTWINEKRQWKIISMQLFEIPKNPPPVVIDSSILKKYSGSYALSEQRTCKVYVENGKLIVKKGTNPPIELLAQTENVFFRKDDGRVDVIFLKSADGSYKMVERREGEDLAWKFIAH